MANKKSVQESVLQRLADSAETGTLPPDVSIVYRVNGGAPGERYEESVVLTGTGDARVTMKDELRSKPAVSAREALGAESPLEICRLLIGGSEHLIPRSQARFLPDTLVGSITVGIGDEAETYFFEIDDDEPGREQAEHVGPAPAAGLRAIRDRFQTIEQAILAKGRGAKEE